MKSMDINDQSADRFEQCRVVVQAVLGKYPDNSAVLDILTKKFLVDAGFVEMWKK